ncbi:MAG: YicC/YloC family endoribonuclease [Thermodesulfovibrio sp.]|uniref:YicC family protein n=1 Tax=Thermodesulfovibrio aggregans TaxID=86166 RepID=A0A2J6WIK5_9BACT|nr:MAG: YicC family protein [Thermodesulfovibrio aggregans]
MIESLTGYGFSEKGTFRVEAKSLNHRFLEINLKLPQILSKHEIEIRNLIRKKFHRGKIDVTVTINQKEKTGRVYLNKNLAKQLYEAFIDLKKELSILGSIDISMFSNFRELFIYEEQQPDVNTLMLTVSEALESLHEMRKKEGQIIKQTLTEIADNLEKDIATLESFVDLGYNNYINSLKNRVKQLITENNLDEKRILEQIILYAQKTDIKEEVDRLQSHIIQFKENIMKGGNVGKKLDFLLQEMNREINTVLAKTEDFQVKTLAIEIKTNIERLKEQIQNIQ